jgi:hypothetical protein
MSEIGAVPAKGRLLFSECSSPPGILLDDGESRIVGRYAPHVASR